MPDPARLPVPPPTARLPRPFVAALLLATALAAGAAHLHAQEPVHVEGLGSLAFPNSGTPEAQEPFLRGVLLLHSFEYDDAAEEFRRAQDADPDFALAYWGEAMTHTHPLWNEKNPEAARAVLARLARTPEARLAKAPTEREKGYLRAVETLYGDGPKERLDTLYSRAMADLHARHPDDLEAQTFYALSLLGLSQGDRNVPTYMEAGALALDAFEKNPGHPGAAHYAIHSFDDPSHAVLAMEAAEAYGPMAPDAAHAQHMTTHIFLARGMWDEVVEANLRADDVVDRARTARGLPPTDCGHYNQWLQYGYQQQGRYDAAGALLRGCAEQADDERLSTNERMGALFSWVYQRNLYLADADAPGAAALRPETTFPGGDDALTSRLAVAWGEGMAALERGDRSRAVEALSLLEEHARRADDSWLSAYAPVWEGTLRAMSLAEAGEMERALEAAQAAADYEASLPVDFGPPGAFKPARELVGELLLVMERPDAALAAFRTALDRTPNRIHSLAGYARAAAAAGHPELADESYRTLAELLEKADPGVRVAEEARGYLRR